MKHRIKVLDHALKGSSKRYEMLFRQQHINSLLKQASSYPMHGAYGKSPAPKTETPRPSPQTRLCLSCAGCACRAPATHAHLTAFRAPNKSGGGTDRQVDLFFLYPNSTEQNERILFYDNSPNNACAWGGSTYLVIEPDLANQPKAQWTLRKGIARLSKGRLVPRFLENMWSRLGTNDECIQVPG